MPVVLRFSNVWFEFRRSSAEILVRMQACSSMPGGCQSGFDIEQQASRNTDWQQVIS